MQVGNLPDPFILVLVLVALALVPFAAMMVTSFIKLAVVLSLVRNALGVQQIPPNLVLNGLAFILSVYIMAPVGQDAIEIMRKENPDPKDFVAVSQAFGKAGEPFREFLIKHSNRDERNFFLKTARVIWPKERAAALKPDDLIILLPSFTVTELTEAFKIGFLLYLPFIVIDLIISNILLAMGMMMVSPMTISLPFKLLLFVLVSGWSKLIHGLVLVYR